MKTRPATTAFALILFWTGITEAEQVPLPGPPGSAAFGNPLLLLPNGQFAVADPGYDAPGPVTDAGAVHVYSAAGTLISTLTGSASGDAVGSGGLVLLTNGNFVVISPLWNGGRGAVTLGRQDSGVSGTVSPANSLVGSAAGDYVGGQGVTALSNGHYVVLSRYWDNGASQDVGAVTWGHGESGAIGGVSPANSLVGASANDQVGSGGLVKLANGSYLVRSPLWDNGAAADAGAITWGDGSTGISGVLSAANSLVGGSANDQVGLQPPKVLQSGHYVVRSPTWDNGAAADAGAVTWGNGSIGLHGVISAANSLVGSHESDQVGFFVGQIQELANGHVVIGSPIWNSGTGAVTWVDGSTGTSGVISAANSLIGEAAGHYVGSRVQPLTNGHYVVTSSWDSSKGAVTWCNGNGPSTGTVSADNSLVGSTAGDEVGYNLLALPNGHYVVAAYTWDHGGVTNVGAVTWCNGTGPTAGAVSAANSLIGSQTDDLIGSHDLIALPSGHYLVESPFWRGIRGAVTWCRGDGTTSGEVSADNSLVGSTPEDRLGNVGIWVLANGNYVVASNSWDHGSAVDAGAVTWGNGNVGVYGEVSAANSLVGSTSVDRVSGVLPLSNGHYLVIAPNWDNGGISDAGAVAWADGTTGLTGVPSAANALIGSSQDDRIGDQVFALKNGHYVAGSSSWDNGGTADVGALAWGNGETGRIGVISPANALIGSTPGDLNSLSLLAFNDGRYLITSRLFDTIHGVDSGAILLAEPLGATTGFFTADNSVFGVVAGGGFNLRPVYDAERTQLLVGQPDANQITLSGQPGRVALAHLFLTGREEDGVVEVPLVRTGGSQGSLTVSVTTAAGTASPGSDYASLIEPSLTFAHGETRKVLAVPLLPDAVANEPDETFTVHLGGDTDLLGEPLQTLVRIVDTGDIKPPGAPVILSPAANARVPANPGAPIQVDVRAADNKGIASVEVSLNDGAFVAARLTEVNGTQALFTLAVTPRTGANVLQVRSTDTSGNTSPLATRPFVATRPLQVQLSGAGTVTPGFAPKSYHEVGKSISLSAFPDAVPAPGHLFSGWTLSGLSPSRLGLSAAALEQSKLTFPFEEGLVLTAHFAPNPFVDLVAGTYQGLIQASPTLPDRAPLGVGPEDGTQPALSTEGSVVVTLQSKGTFSGKVQIGGLLLPVSGLFMPDGSARFGPLRSRTLSLARPGLPALALELQLDVSPPLADGLTGSVTQRYRSVVTAVSEIQAAYAYYNGKTRFVPADLLATGGKLTAVLPAQPPGSQPAGFTAADYPQGDGLATLSVAGTGWVKLAGLLADGTPVTAAAPLSEAQTWPLFASLYKKLGFVAGDVVFDTSRPESDCHAGSLRWSRPYLGTPHYPYGWPETLVLGLTGARYAVTAGESLLKAPDGPDLDDLGEPLNPPSPTGNAELLWQDGLLTGPLTRAVNLAPTQAATNVPAGDKSYSLKLQAPTGRFSGSFPHTNGGRATFQGIVLQKGLAAGGYGYFLTPLPKTAAAAGESGSVRLQAVP